MKKIKFFIFLALFMLVGCNIETPGNVDNSGVQEQPKEEEKYVPSESVLSFSEKKFDKVITEPTFDVASITDDAKDNIKPYGYFQDGMCLQRDAINRIWGKASKTQNIAIEINGKVYYGSVKSREWEVYLPKMNAGGPYEMTIISDLGRYEISNVYIGEVYFLGGQSNMELQPQHVGNAMEYLYSSSDCVNEKIRMLHIDYHPQTEETNEVINTSKWKSANQSTIREFTAVGYIFGKQMQEELDCPVGLVAAPVGGSNIEFWLNEENYGKVLEAYRPYINSDEYMQPMLGYNGMLYPLTGINVRGVVWYQGCSNAFGTQKNYDIALELFIEQCREMFDNEQLSFTICELARFNERPLAYSIINERINYVASKDPYVAVARNLDLGDWFDIHPKDKRGVAGRAAYETLRCFFNKDKAEPIKVVNYTFDSDGGVTIYLSCDANLVNGKNGFEVEVNGKYTYDCTVILAESTLKITAAGTITSVRYGYTCEMNSEIEKDVSKMVTIYDNNGFPLDLFLISSSDNN